MIVLVKMIRMMITDMIIHEMYEIDNDSECAGNGDEEGGSVTLHWRGSGVLGESGSGQVSPGQLGSGQLKLFFMASLTSTALVRSHQVWLRWRREWP